MTRPPTTGDRDSNGLNSRNPLRLWPGVAIVALQWLVTFGVPLVARDAEVFSLPIGLIAVIAGVLGGLAIVIWWVFFSRALWSERLGAIILIDLRGVCDEARRPRVDRGGGDGDVALHLVDPVPEPRPRRMGGGHAQFLQQYAARGAGRGHRARMRAVGAVTNSRGQRRGFRVPLAVDADS